MRWHTNLRLPEPAATEQRSWRLGIDAADRIAVLEPLLPGSTASGENWHGAWLSPLGIDLQINGGLGLPFPELQPEQLPRLLELLDLLWRDGVEAICPTLVTCGVAPLRQALAVLEQARQQHRSGRCQLLGAHLEGPFLAPERRGAHPLQHLCPPSLAALEQRIAGFENQIALVTLAPELEGAAALIHRLRQLGIAVSLGHSAADEAQARIAYDQGVTLLTHAFNAMAGMHHRAPGPVAAACLRNDVALGLIADGVHVAPSMLLLLLQLAPGRVFLVSDALAPYGLADGEYRWDERVLMVHKGACRLADGTLAGVTLPLLEGVRRLAEWGCPAGQAIAAATLTPRQALGDQRSAAEMLLGMPITETLLWQQDNSGLNWRRYGAAQLKGL